MRIGSKAGFSDRILRVRCFQCSHALGRPILHFVLSSRRPRLEAVDRVTSSLAPHIAQCLCSSQWPFLRPWSIRGSSGSDACIIGPGQLEGASFSSRAVSYALIGPRICGSSGGISLAAEHVERRLAAVLAADVASYRLRWGREVRRFEGPEEETRHLCQGTCNQPHVVWTENAR